MEAPSSDPVPQKLVRPRGSDESLAQREITCRTLHGRRRKATRTVRVIRLAKTMILFFFPYERYRFFFACLIDTEWPFRRHCDWFSLCQSALCGSIFLSSSKENCFRLTRNGGSSSQTDKAVSGSTSSV